MLSSTSRPIKVLSGLLLFLTALLTAFGLGSPLREVLDAAVHAQARGGAAM